MEEYEDFLPWSEVPNLLKLYEDAGDEHYWAYLVVENVQRWHLSFPECDSFILSPGGKINANGTSMVVYPLRHTMVNLILLDKNSNMLEIKTFLSKCIQNVSKKWPVLIFGPLLVKYGPILAEAAPAANLTSLMKSCSTCYYMDKDLAKNLPLNCPEEVYIASVKEEHADLINSLWPHKFEDSVNLIRTLIHRNGGIALHLKENDEIVSWGLHGLYNGPANIQTVEKHKRKGLATLATVAISKFVAQKGLHPLFYVVDENLPAHNLYTKLAFVKIHMADWYTWGRS